MKKWLISMLTMILCILTPVAAFAQNEELEDEGFLLEINISDNSEQFYIIDGIQFRVLPTLTRGLVYPSKSVEMTDLYNNARLGTVKITATAVYDGKVVAVTKPKTEILYRPTSSNLKATNTSIIDNNTRLAKVNSTVSYTGSNGKTGGGTISLFIYANGAYN